MNILLIDKDKNTLEFDSSSLYIKVGDNDYTLLNDLINNIVDYSLIHNETQDELNDTIQAFLTTFE